MFYNGGQRIRKSVDKGSIKEERIYLGSFEIYRKFDHTSSLIIERQTVHLSDDAGRIAMLETRTVGDAIDDHGTAEELTRYIYSNHLQSASLELDEAGEIISYEEYHPYGTTSYQAMNASINAIAKRYRYTGKERDEESGLYYHGARYYIPWLTRWTAVDVLQSEMPIWSPYNYGFCNPVIFNDPSGNQPDNVSQHIVKENETLSGIAKQYNTTVDELYKNNPHLPQDATKLKIGTKINFTKATNEKTLPKYNYSAKDFIFIMPADELGHYSRKNIPLNINYIQEKPLIGIKSTDKISTPWMKIAESQLGVKEKTKNNDGPEVEMYLKSGGLGKGQPWCGAFVNWVLLESEIEITVTDNNPNWALNWRGFGVKLDKPAFGAIATKTRKGGGHVGFVAGMTKDGNVVVLGGNQNDAVTYQVYPISVLKFNFPKGFTPQYKLPILEIKSGKIKEN